MLQNIDKTAEKIVEVARDKELKLLRSLTMKSPVIVLYGQSGSGKRSAIELANKELARDNETYYPSYEGRLLRKPEDVYRIIEDNRKKGAFYDGFKNICYTTCFREVADGLEQKSDVYVVRMVPK